MKTEFDDVKGYCRMLGHMLTFRYCRSVNDELPCRKVMDCWYDKFPVQEFLSENYTEEELKKAFGMQQNRLSTIISIVQKHSDDIKEKNFYETH